MMQYYVGLNKEYDLNKRTPHYNLNSLRFQY